MMTLEKFLQLLKKHSRRVKWVIRDGKLRTKGYGHCPLTYVAYKETGVEFQNPESMPIHLMMNALNIGPLCIRDISGAADNKNSIWNKGLREKLIEITKPETP